VYDSEHQNVVLFGGRSTQVENDLWTYSFEDNIWTEVSQAGQPDSIYGHSMVYDSLNSMLVVFGGRQSYFLTTELYNQTWTYDHTENEWTQMNPIARPTQRVLTAMTFDSNENRVFLFGGICNIPTVEEELSDELWVYEFHSNEWRMISQDMSSNLLVRIELILLISGVLALVLIVIVYRRSVRSN
jgi:N-acetylneuraminic acid mutarotase